MLNYIYRNGQRYACYYNDATDIYTEVPAPDQTSVKDKRDSRGKGAKHGKD